MNSNIQLGIIFLYFRQEECLPGGCFMELFVQLGIIFLYFRQEECSPGGCFMELCVQLGIIFLFFRQEECSPGGCFMELCVQLGIIFHYFRQEECSPGGCFMELCVQLGIIFLGKQFFLSIVEYYMPFIWKLLNFLKLGYSIKFDIYKLYVRWLPRKLLSMHDKQES